MNEIINCPRKQNILPTSHRLQVVTCIKLKTLMLAYTSKKDQTKPVSHLSHHALHHIPIKHQAWLNWPIVSQGTYQKNIQGYVQSIKD